MSVGRTPWDGLEAHRASLQRLISCISSAVVTIQRSDRRLDQPLTLSRQFTVANGERISLRADHPIAMSIVQECRIESPTIQEQHYSITISRYIYLFTLTDATEVIAYHWHPGTRSHIVDPHLHIGPATIGTNATYRPGMMHKTHFPTGFVPLASVIRMAIEELGVEPRRRDWDMILRRTDHP